jgi:hypothetical protein
MNEATTPAEVIMSGNRSESVFMISSVEVAETTRAAQVDSARDPNKSAPIPAISPTLSPTLSAIVPGFFGESSGRSLRFFPTRSDPTSAALV